MDTAKVEKAKKTINDTIAVYNGVLKVGKKSFEEFATKIAAVCAAGALVKGVYDLLQPEKPDPVMLKLRELEAKIEQLSDKMSNHFNDLKSFMSEHHFYADVARSASTLSKLMQDTISHPSQHSIGIFQAETVRNPPLTNALNLISLLEQECTNPLKMAMKADVYKKRATFEKWENTIYGVLTQLLLLETYLNGMFWDSNMHGPNRLKERIKGLEAHFNKWRNEYKESYWPVAVQKLIENTQDDYVHLNNDPKCLIIKQALMDMLTDDVFYILVYDTCGGYDNHSFYGKSDQYVVSYRRKGCNIVVYRSRHWRNSSQAAFDTIKRETEALRDNKLPDRGYYDDVPARLMNEHFSSAGFVGMVKADKTLAIRSANSFGREWGPGWWITARIKTSVLYNTWKEFIVVAGYK